MLNSACEEDAETDTDVPASPVSRLNPSTGQAACNESKRICQQSVCKKKKVYIGKPRVLEGLLWGQSLGRLPLQAAEQEVQQVGVITIEDRRQWSTVGRAQVAFRVVVWFWRVVFVFQGETSELYYFFLGVRRTKELLHARGRLNKRLWRRAYHLNDATHEVDLVIGRK